MNGAAWNVADAAALVASIDTELERRAERDKALLAKGRLDPREAEYHAAITADIRADLIHAFGPFDPAVGYTRPDPAIDWRAKVKWISAELAEREEKSPGLVAKGRLTEAEAARGIHLFAALRRLYWNSMFMWEPTGEASRRWLAELKRRIRAGGVAALSGPASDDERTFRAEIREVAAVIEQDLGGGQGDLLGGQEQAA